MRSGWNASRPSVRSPVPMNATGRPVTLRMPSAAPPRASPSILVSTSAGERQAGVERLGDAHRLLAGHGVDHQQRLGRGHDAADAHQLVHHRLVHVEAAGGVEDHDVDVLLARQLEAGARDLERRRPDRAAVNLDPDLVAELHDLVDRCGAVDVGRHEERLLAVLAQPNRQLGGGRRLARALQADEHEDRRLASELQLVALAAEDRHQLVVDHLDDLLARVQPAEHLQAQGSLAHARHELLDDLEVDVRLEQGKPNLAQRDVEVGLGDAGLAAQALGDRLQARGEGLEHGWTDVGRALAMGRRVKRLPILAHAQSANSHST